MLRILYQDAWIVAIDKPSGLLVHRSPIDKREHRFALQEVRNLIGQHVYPVHRLDKPTSGTLLFALDPTVAATLSHMFRSGDVEKSYVAVVRGYTDAQGVIDHPLKQMLDTKAQKAQGITKEAQEALTYYHTLARVELPFCVDRYPTTRYSMVALQPKSGRKHQLRRHMKHIHHHMIGDTKHGRGEHNRFFREHFGLTRLLLHAYKLSFNHPVSGKKLDIQAPLCDEFLQIVEKLGWNGIELGT